MQSIARLSLGLLILATVPLSAQSPYVPMDSWVYPAFERLIATGFISGAYLGIRPWTRAECLRLIEEAEERLRMDESASALSDSEPSGKRWVRNDSLSVEWVGFCAAVLAVEIEDAALKGRLYTSAAGSSE